MVPVVMVLAGGCCTGLCPVVMGTAFPALFRTDNSEAGLALRISFLFWKEILKSSHVRDRSKCLGGSSS
jgi:hypothetical protein